MAGENNGPRIRFRAATYPETEESGPSSIEQPRLKKGFSDIGESRESSPSRPTTPSVYLGSFARDVARKRLSLRGDAGSLQGSVAPSPRASMSHIQLQHLLQTVDVDLDTYDLQEHRDGFFDASFCRPSNRDHVQMMIDASETLPEGFLRKKPLSLRGFIPQQWHELLDIIKQITTSRAGVKLLKSFSGFLITYLMCLIPASRDWLGRYNYIMVMSTIINHSGRPLGSQIDGTVLTVVGTAAGLGWGSLALYASTSTNPARSGYGGVLATFLVLFTAAIAWLRCVYMRFFQAGISAGIAICYICLADTSRIIGWRKVFDYGIPWVLGQVVCLLVSILVFPDLGTHSIGIAFHRSLKAIEDGLVLPRQEKRHSRQNLAWNFVNLSEAVRDFTIDLSISRFRPDDIRSLRNLVQGVIRAVLAIKPNTALFDFVAPSDEDMDTNNRIQAPLYDDEAVLRLMGKYLAGPTRELIEAMSDSVSTTDAIMRDIGGYKRPSTCMSISDIRKLLDRLKAARHGFDSADSLLTGHPRLPSTLSDNPEVVELFLFVHPVRLAADKVEALLEKSLQIWQAEQRLRVHFPSYPLSKALLRCNAQVRHDRGGLTAGFYFQSKHQLEKTMRQLQSKVYVPTPRNPTTSSGSSVPVDQMPVIGRFEQEKRLAMGEDKGVSKKVKLRFSTWSFLHNLQGFEVRFAFKVTLVAALLSVPAWLEQSQDWWNAYESWWTVVTVWLMMHPRVGGTFQDLTVRVFYAAIGATWAGFAYTAGKGNSYVMAVFAALFMIPMLHRFTQSSHPRSGVVGCISFTVVSLGLYTEGGKPSTVIYVWTRGVAFVVGVVAALLVNWILWPFVARHELRKSLSAMMLHSAILYRSVVARYIYYTEGQEPGPEDVARSEMLEGRLREGFVRIRQLMELTRHEIRLRAPFDPLPYSALVDACERFYEYLVEVRQSSVYFQPHMLASSSSAATALMGPRRDAVAVILMDLYILACALRNDHPVPRYLPSAAAARQRLLDRMELVEPGQEGETVEIRSGRTRRWADIYHYAYSSALTDIVAQLQRLQRYTKEICGEIGIDAFEAKQGTCNDI